MTDLDLTGLCVLAQLVSGEILWSPVLEENVRMIVSAPQLKHVSTSNVKILAKMLVELALNVNQSTTEPSVLAQMGTLETP
jgi:hypothetical protein